MDPFEELEDAIEEVDEEEAPDTTADRIKPTAIILVGIVALFIGLALGYLGRGMFGPEARSANSTATVAAAAVETRAAMNKQVMDLLISETKHFIGEESAPVTILEFSDFQCPYCGVFAGETSSKIKEKYIKQGKVRFGYIHFTFLGDESVWAAEASECAADQGKFWEFHDLLFTSQNGENGGAFSKENLKKFGVQLGLDSKEFNECLDSGKHSESVAQQTNIARQIGVQSTPSFLVNGTPVVGAQPFESFQQLIEQFITKQ